MKNAVEVSREIRANSISKGGGRFPETAQYKVRSIKTEQCKEWLLYKHYAHRIPSISYAFGLFDNENILQGVCTFGSPCRYYNNGEFVFNNYSVLTLELNRLIINDNNISNLLSFFVSKSIKFLPFCCIVSYADYNKGHNGYIYQALNFLYTGLNDVHDTEYIINGRETHSRTLTGAGITAPKQWAKDNEIERTPIGRKHRYFYFRGSKKQLKQMRGYFRFPILPYPKGDNKRYDASYQPLIQSEIF